MTGAWLLRVSGGWIESAHWGFELTLFWQERGSIRALWTTVRMISVWLSLEFRRTSTV